MRGECCKFVMPNSGEKYNVILLYMTETEYDIYVGLEGDWYTGILVGFCGVR
jgi:hypothetical protein